MSGRVYLYLGATLNDSSKTRPDIKPALLGEAGEGSNSTWAYYTFRVDLVFRKTRKVFTWFWKNWIQLRAANNCIPTSWLFLYLKAKIIDMNEKIKFQPLSFSWVAIHPNPKGVIQFIGGAFFGSFPTIFYRYLLQALFNEGYTLIALPFRFSFRHWSMAISLLEEQHVLSQEISHIATRLNYPTNVYQNPENYFWIGHSLGCKYIALLELLSGNRWRDILKPCNSGANSQIRRIESSISHNPHLQRSIKGQPSLLIAPDISDTQSAIPRPLAFIAHFLDSKNLGVIPTRQQTLCYIDKSYLFNLTGIISFDKDTIAGSETDRFKDEQQRRDSDVLWLIEYLKQGKLPLLHQELSGKHLAPLGIQVGNYVIELNPLTKFMQRIQDRPLERVVIQFLDKLKMRRQNLPQ